MRILYSALLCLFICNTPIVANNIDSLKQEFSIQSNPFKKSNLSYQIANAFRRTSEGDSILHYGKIAMQQLKPGNQSKTMVDAKLITGVGYWKIGDFKKAMEIFQDCEEIAKNKRYDKQLYNATSNIALIHAEQSNFDEAIKIWKQQVAKHSSAIDLDIVAAKYNNIGLAIQMKGDYEAASDNFIKGLAIAEDLKDTLLQIRFKNNLGLVLREFGDTTQALELFELTGQLSKAIGNKQFEGMAHNNLGSTYQGLGQYDTALSYFKTSLENNKSVNEKKGIAASYGNIAHVHFLLKNIEAAQIALDESMSMMKEMDSKISIIILDRLQSKIFVEQGKILEAIQLLEAAKIQSQDINSTSELKNTILELSNCYSLNGQFEKANEELLSYSKIMKNSKKGPRLSQMVAMESQYELEKAKGVIAANKTKIKNQLAFEKFWKMVVGLSFLAILFLGFALRSKYKLAQLIKADNNKLLNQNSRLRDESSELKSTNESLEAELLSISKKLQEPDFLKEGTITLSNRQKTVLKLGDIIYIKASQNGVQIVTTTEKFIYWKGIGKFILDLPPSLFVQTHRSYIVNKAHVKAIQSEQLKMSNNELVRIGGDYKKKTASKIKGKD